MPGPKKDRLTAAEGLAEIQMRKPDNELSNAQRRRHVPDLVSFLEDKCLTNGIITSVDIQKKSRGQPKDRSQGTDICSPGLTLMKRKKKIMKDDGPSVKYFFKGIVSSLGVKPLSREGNSQTGDWMPRNNNQKR